MDPSRDYYVQNEPETLALQSLDWPGDMTRNRPRTAQASGSEKVTVRFIEHTIYRYRVRMSVGIGWSRCHGPVLTDAGRDQTSPRARPAEGVTARAGPALFSRAVREEMGQIYSAPEVLETTNRYNENDGVSKRVHCTSRR